MIDLSKWQGKSIKVAFVYKMLKTTATCSISTTWW